MMVCGCCELYIESASKRWERHDTVFSFLLKQVIIVAILIFIFFMYITLIVENILYELKKNGG